MTTIIALQKRLAADGFDPKGVDGLIGPNTIAAVFAALAALRVARGKPPTAEPVAGLDPAFAELIPAEWLPFCKMNGVIVHWTGGGHRANAKDRKSYHLLIEGDGKLVRGNPPITANAAPRQPGYAAHTANCNTGWIGVSLCGMLDAKESPFVAGPQPITQTQWKTLEGVVAQLCTRYAIPVTAGTVLSHAEVQGTLGIRQAGKWDIARLPFDPALSGARAVGDRLRAGVAAYL